MVQVTVFSIVLASANPLDRPERPGDVLPNAPVQLDDCCPVGGAQWSTVELPGSDHGLLDEYSPSALSDEVCAGITSRPVPAAHLPFQAGAPTPAPQQLQ